MRYIITYLFILYVVLMGGIYIHPLQACPTKTPNYFYQKGEQFIQEYTGDGHQLKKANKYFEHLIEKYPNSPLGYLGISRIYIIEAYQFDNYFNMEDIRNHALPFAVQALELGPLLPAVHINYSLLENIFEQHREIQELTQKYLTLLPEEPETFFLIGKYLYSQHDHAKSLEFFQTALELNPKDDLKYKILTRIGVLYLNKLKAPDKALETFKQALALKQDSADIFHYIGLSYLNMEQYEDSIDYFKKSMKFYSNSITDKYLLQAQGYLYQEKGQNEKAILYLEKAVSLGMKDSRLLYNLGNLYFNAANYSKAYDHFKNVIDLRPEAYMDAYYFAGRSAESLGDRDVATDYFKKYLQLNRQGPEADWIRKNIPDLSQILPID